MLEINGIDDYLYYILSLPNLMQMAHDVSKVL